MYGGLIRKPFSQAVRRALVSNIPTVGKSVSPIIRPFHRTALRYNTSVGNGNNTAQIKVDKPEMMIAFTCKKCDTRSSHIMSKQAYTSGTVLITCPSCKNRHLIADHLKIFSDSRVTIQDILSAKGESVSSNTDDLVFDDIPEKLKGLIGHHAKDAPQKETESKEGQYLADKDGSKGN